MNDEVWGERRSGRRQHAEDVRSNFEVDYARVIHSGAFRRLQGKTQILSLGDDDFYRSRLTHSMEVAQVAEGIAQRLRVIELPEAATGLVPSAPLIQAVGLAHDIGHPPFGHGGELALNYCMRDAGGFEGNAQTLRLLSRLESFSDANGADLTRRTLLGILKYPALYSMARNTTIIPALSQTPTTISVLNVSSCRPVKACYDEDCRTIEWILEPISVEDRTRFLTLKQREGKHGQTNHKSFDCSIMDLADDIAYGVHDLEDAIALGFVTQSQFADAIDPTTCTHLLATLARRPLVADGCGDHSELVARLFGSAAARKGAIGRLVHYFIREVTVREDRAFDSSLLRCTVALQAEAGHLLDELKGLVARLVIDSPKVQHLEFKGQRMVIAVFEAIASNPAQLLPPELAKAFERAENPTRVLCDYIASFTDGALLRTYERLFSPRVGSVFDRI